MEPTLMQSYEPTMEPTYFPTSVDNRYSVGDYKLSANPQSHGRWLKCDGSLYAIADYPELFDMIGYTFTMNTQSDDTMFAVPDSRDRVIGMYGSTHLFGDIEGSESVQLTEDHLPPHHHYISNEDVSTNTYDNSTNRYLSITNGAYILYGSDSVPNSFQSSNVGQGKAFDVHQPTIFMANAFIFA